MGQPALDHVHAGVARLHAKAGTLERGDDLRVHGLDVDVDLEFARLVDTRQGHFKVARVYPGLQVGVRLLKASQNDVVLLLDVEEIHLDVRRDLAGLKRLRRCKPGGAQEQTRFQNLKSRERYITPFDVLHRKPPF